MDLLIYLLKVSACTVLFFAVYLLGLKRLTFFSFNRFYLLTAMILSFVIPALHFNVERVVDSVDTVSTPAIEIQNKVEIQALKLLEGSNSVNTISINWISLSLYVYFIVVVMLLVFSFWQLFKLIKQTKNQSENRNGLKLIFKSDGFTNCSFFNYVFIDRQKLSKTEIDVLIKHEQVHANQYHSIDKVLMMISKAVLWFNPVIYLYDKELEQVHEYEADQIASADVGNKAYANLILKMAVSDDKMPLIHNFVKSPIKERIKMLFNLKSKNMKKLIYLLAVPIGFVLVWVFSVQFVYAESDVKSTDLSSKDKNESIDVKKQTVKLSDERNPVKKNNQKTNLKNGNSVDKLEHNNEISKVLPIIPNIVSYNELKGYSKDIIYFKGVLIIIDGKTLNAEELEYNHTAKTIIAKRATLKFEDGKTISGEKLIYDLNKNVYEFENTKQTTKAYLGSGNINFNQAQNGGWANFTFKAKDSVKMNRDSTIITLYGDAKFIYSRGEILGNEIVYNKINKTVYVKNGSIKENQSGVNRIIKNTYINLNN